MKTVYGPVSSWRLGRSIGIDPVCSEKKICSFDCVYCQLGHSALTVERKKFITVERLEADLAPFKDAEADIFTFSGTGEPTLATNLMELTETLRQFRQLPIAILTNSTFLAEPEVRDALQKLDIVIAKLDALDEKLFQEINRPHKSILFDAHLEAMKTFRKGFKGKFALQSMFIEVNKDYAEDIAKIARELAPDEIQLNTPLRPCAVPALSREEMAKIQQHFRGFEDVISVYDAEKPKVQPVDLAEIHIRKRPEP